MRAALLRVVSRTIALAMALWIPTVGAGASPRPSDGRSVTLQDAPESNGADLVVARRPVRYEENLGQTDSVVRFLARGAGHTLFLTETEAVLTVANPRFSRASRRDSPLTSDRTIEPVEGQVLRMRLVGVNPEPVITSGTELPGVSNYFRGDDPSRWRTGVRAFDSVRYTDVYPGVDLVFYGHESAGASQALEYDFVVGPGADPRAIVLTFEGADSIGVDREGYLTIGAGLVEVRQPPPTLYQVSDTGREPVAGRYSVARDGTIGFDVGAYDPERALVIDPVLAFSTYLGGGFDEYMYDVAVDEWGNTFVVGRTFSADFPRVNGPYGFRGESDAFVTVLGRLGMALAYSTYLGGSDHDYATSLALDVEGAVYLTGATSSANFPTVNPIETDAGNPDADAFVAKLSPTGTSLVYSTYLGGNLEDRAYGIAVDPSGSAFVAGETSSTDFPTVNQFQPDPGAGFDAFVARLSVSGTSLVYSTYLGGAGDDYANAVAVMGGSEAVAVGATHSVNFPRFNAYQDTLQGSVDAFVTKLSASGSTVRYSTYVGGDSADIASDVALDSEGAPVVVGSTLSADFPTRNPIRSDPGDGDFDGFALKLAFDGESLRFSTYLPGSIEDYATGVAVGADNRPVIVGTTFSTDFPVYNALYVNADGADKEDAFVTCLNANGTAYVYSTYLGGGNQDYGNRVAADGSGNAYVVGDTYSSNFPTVSAYQSALRGGEDSFVAKIGNATADLDLDLTVSPEPVRPDGELTYTMTIGNSGPNAAGEVIAALGVPSGTRYVSHDVSQGRFEPPDAVGFGYFFAGRVPQGTAATLTLVVRVDAPAGATVANQATVITTAQDPMSANNSASVTSHVISGTVPPDIANVESLVVTGKPYRIRITGTNFQPGVEVYIGTDMTPWANVKRKSETVLIMKKGGDLKARFPRGVAVQIRVVNPDTGSDSFAFAR